MITCGCRSQERAPGSYSFVSRREIASCRDYRFSGTLEKLTVVLEPEKLSEEERKALKDALSRGLMANQ
jgi:hypothetical protein